ncbi:Gtr1/RagA G protein conserved region-domain-containing protein [Podospora appendiculata]|uniref:GTP-binding protein n=1 Tax=Podospora appendiculata TaxID=314037 RepID=A0AAE0XG04_9PEZI|nr:Gtr1/RagA G protein conserved region-domain-containing protein [Podospora appendiculata]
MSFAFRGGNRAGVDAGNGPSSRPVRTTYLSQAVLNLHRVYEQNRQRLQKKDGAKVPDPIAVPQTKGKPRLLLMGQRRSGKSSISSVVFHKLPPSETLFLESTARIQKDSLNSFMDFQVWDFPGQIDVFDNPNFAFDMDAIFGEIGALIWVIDAQDDYLEAVARLNNTILHLQRGYPHINIEVFIHKVDGLSDDYKLDIQRDVTIRIQDELSDQGVENAPVNFHLTSIYNHSIFEAFSKVIQKLIPRLGQLEAMLTNLCRTCRFEKAYLFDVNTKIYIATDSTPEDMASYEICSDYVDVIIDFTEVYGSWQRSPEWRKRLEGPPWMQRLDDQVACEWAESGMVLSEAQRPIMLREVDRFLALVAIMKEGSYEKMPQINMNVDVVVKGLTEFFEITKPKDLSTPGAGPSGAGSGPGQ